MLPIIKATHQAIPLKPPKKSAESETIAAVQRLFTNTKLGTGVPDNSSVCYLHIESPLARWKRYNQLVSATSNMMVDPSLKENKKSRLAALEAIFNRITDQSFKLEIYREIGKLKTGSNYARQYGRDHFADDLGLVNYLLKCKQLRSRMDLIMKDPRLRANRSKRLSVLHRVFNQVAGAEFKGQIYKKIGEMAGKHKDSAMKYGRELFYDIPSICRALDSINLSIENRLVDARKKNNR